MKRITLLLFVLTTFAAVAVFTVTTSRHVTAPEPTPIFVKKIPTGYRDWKVVLVAHEAGDLNDIRAVLGNNIAIKAYREGKLPFPETAIIGRITGAFVPSEENNKTFVRDQSFLAGSPLTNTAIASARLYRDTRHTLPPYGSFFDVRGVKLPVAASAFAEEIYQAPKSWAEKAYPKLIFYNKHDKGTHFAAWEQPELFVSDLHEAFKPLR